jgi:DNA polymerase
MNAEMTRELIEQLSDIAKQLEEQAKFYRDIGVTDIGGAALPEQAPEASSGQEVSNALYQMASKAPERDEAILSELRASSLIEPAKVEQVSLFGNREASDRPLIGRASLKVVQPDSSLDAIREDLGECIRCRLHETRTNIVFGEGNPQARLVFVGEGPGADEDASGRPFVGRAGQLLNKIIESIGFRRDQVYICNVVKCRPPGNRNPERDEADTCEPFLFRQLTFIQPQVIVALGLPAFQCLLKTKEGITRARGQWREWNGIKLMPTFHPAFLLRSPDKKRETWEDMKKVRDYLASQGA